MLRAEDQLNSHVGDGTIKIMQEHDRMSVPKVYRRLYVSAIWLAIVSAALSNTCVIIVGAVTKLALKKA